MSILVVSLRRDICINMYLVQVINAFVFFYNAVFGSVIGV